MVRRPYVKVAPTDSAKPAPNARDGVHAPGGTVPAITRSTLDTADSAVNRYPSAVRIVIAIGSAPGFET